MTFTPKMLCSRIRTCRVRIEDLDFRKVLGVMHMAKYFGDRFICEIILSHKHSFTDDLQTITYYIIYTLTRIRNTFYLCRTCLHALTLRHFT